MYRLFFVLFSIAIALSGQTLWAQAKNQPLTGQRFTGEITVNASPEQVWQALTDGHQLTEILGYQYQGGQNKLNNAGESVQVKVWGDAGSFTLVRATPYKELRFNLDPDNGSYICNCSWKLTKAAGGTTVRFDERYTESSPQSAEDIAAQVKDTNEMLLRLKEKAEKK